MPLSCGEIICERVYLISYLSIEPASGLDCVSWSPAFLGCVHESHSATWLLQPLPLFPLCHEGVQFDICRLCSSNRYSAFQTRGDINRKPPNIWGYERALISYPKAVDYGTCSRTRSSHPELKTCACSHLCRVPWNCLTADCSVAKDRKVKQVGNL